MLSQRLRERQWLLAVASVTVIAFGIQNNNLLLAAPVILLFFAVAAFVPLSARFEAVAGTNGAAQTTVIHSLSAADFAGALGDPVIFFDRAGLVVEANTAAAQAFGPMRPASSLLLRFRTPEIRELVDQAIAGQPMSAIEYAERLPLERAFRVSAVSIGAGQPLLALVFEDQSEMRRIDRMRADFIANASHELRTPLASVAGFIETLRGAARNDPRAREQFLDIMQSQTSRMSRLIDDLLSLSRLEMKPRIDATSTVDVRDIVVRVVDTLAPLAAESGVLIEKQLDEIDGIVPGDRDELFQVVENLLENACKYGQSGGRVVVSVSAGTSGPTPEVDVTVTDFGPGIPAEHLPRITERFYRVDVESSRAQKGTGLGLAIVKHILTRHGGRLTVKSEPAKGSSFTAHLPFSR